MNGSAGSCASEISIGDYVLTGGEPAALVVIDAVTRLIPGVLGNRESAVAISFSTGLLEHPHYTRPREFMGILFRTCSYREIIKKSICGGIKNP